MRCEYNFEISLLLPIGQLYRSSYLYTLEGFQRTWVADPQALHRSNFLALTNDLDFYEAARKLITDEAYWRTEEQHFKDLLQLCS